MEQFLLNFPNKLFHKAKYKQKSLSFLHVTREPIGCENQERCDDSDASI